jgi:hypothetical protein
VTRAGYHSPRHAATTGGLPMLGGREADSASQPRSYPSDPVVCRHRKVDAGVEARNPHARYAVYGMRPTSWP